MLYYYPSFQFGVDSLIQLWNPCPFSLKGTYFPAWSSKGEPHLSCVLPSIHLTLLLSLCHPINFCRDAWAVPIIFIHAEYELKLEDWAIICFLSKVSMLTANLKSTGHFVTDKLFVDTLTLARTVEEVLFFVWTLQLIVSFPFIKCAKMARTMEIVNEEAQVWAFRRKNSSNSFFFFGLTCKLHFH